MKIVRTIRACVGLVLLFGSLSASGQGFGPTVHADRKVTFSVAAPKAESVELFGDWMKPGTTEKMTNDKGVWSVTVGPLEPTVSIYHFVVDGMTIADPLNPKMKLRARTSASLVEVPADPPALWQAQDVPHGTIHVHPHLAPSLNNETREFRVYTPPGYDAKENAEKRYPILYLLHGSNDTASGWTDVGRAHFILDNLIAQKKAVPMIVVMPFGHAIPFGNRGGDNVAAFQRYLFDDVVPLVEKHYRGAPGRENRAIVGLSMGGGQALSIGLSHLDRFSHVAAFSAAVPGAFEEKFKTLLDDAKGANEQLKLLWIGCGRQDSIFPRTRELSELLKTKGVRHTYHPTEGLHVFAVWRDYLIEVAPLLFRDQGTR